MIEIHVNKDSVIIYIPGEPPAECSMEQLSRIVELSLKYNLKTAVNVVMKGRL